MKSSKMIVWSRLDHLPSIFKEIVLKNKMQSNP